jgi:hypothetical protein
MLQVLGRAGLRAVANYGPAVGTQGHNLLTSLRGFSAQAQPAEGAGADEPTLLAAMRQCLPPAAPVSPLPGPTAIAAAAAGRQQACSSAGW